MPLAAPATSAAFTSLMVSLASQNVSLLSYCFPDEPTTDVSKNWVPYTQDCELRTDCWCFHVQGDMSSARNPDGYKTCYPRNDPKAHIATCGNTERDRSCGCLSGSPCLFSDSRAAKLLAAVTAARAAGVTHIVEEGRFGGLSAYLYALHGFAVTSVEFLPLTGPKVALSQLAPGVRQVDGNGKTLLPSIIGAMSDKQAARTMVIFDGEKRFDAYETYRKIRERVGLAVFDDTQSSKPFRSFLEKNEVYFDTADDAFATFLAREKPTLRLLKPLRSTEKKGINFMGGIHTLDKYHFGIVMGGGWASRRKG